VEPTGEKAKTTKIIMRKIINAGVCSMHVLEVPGGDSKKGGESREGQTKKRR